LTVTVRTFRQYPFVTRDNDHISTRQVPSVTRDRRIDLNSTVISTSLAP